MKINEIKKEEVVVSKETVAEFSAKEIAILLAREVMIQGHLLPIEDEEKYDTVVNMQISVIHKTDDWGMNGHWVGELIGATVKIKPKEE